MNYQIYYYDLTKYTVSFDQWLEKYNVYFNLALEVHDDSFECKHLRFEGQKHLLYDTWTFGINIDIENSNNIISYLIHFEEIWTCFN